ncbi:MAG: carboxylesterase family protein [Flavobacteriales bacterium]|nr:carboxylesterase family protein [Flavobacteriales bacterium]
MSLQRALLFLACILPVVAAAQSCDHDYVTRQFDVQVENDVFYGTATRFDGGTDSLRMNIYKPIGDDVQARPVLVAIHGGAFTGGHRNDMNTMCSWYAERGYVAVTVSYRLGFYTPALLPSPYAYDQAEVIRAAYRAQQDVKGAIRFLRGRSELDSSDVTNYSVMGVSAGGITALHVAYATEELEKPASCGAASAVNQFLSQYPRPDLGPVNGELHLGEDATVNACVSYFGGILDTMMIGSADDPALFTYHQTGDPIVGCGHQQGLWGMPFGIGGNYPWLFGSCAMHPYVQSLGFSDMRYEYHPHTGNAHDIHDLPLVDGWAAAFLARQFCSPITGLDHEAAALEPLVFPNPATERINVTLEEQTTLQLQLLAMDGRMVARGSGTTISVGHLAAGPYLLEVRSEAGQWTRSVVISR